MPIYLLWLPSGIGARAGARSRCRAKYQGVIASMLAAGFYSYAVQKVGRRRSLDDAGAGARQFTAIGAYLILGEALGLITIVGIVVVSIGALLGALPPAAPPSRFGMRCERRAEPPRARAPMRMIARLGIALELRCARRSAVERSRHGRDKFEPHGANRR